MIPASQKIVLRPKAQGLVFMEGLGVCYMVADHLLVLKLGICKITDVKDRELYPMVIGCAVVFFRVFADGDEMVIPYLLSTCRLRN